MALEIDSRHFEGGANLTEPDGKGLGALLNKVDSDLSSLKANSPASGLGWGDYADTQYTQGSPFLLSADVDTPLPNNALSGPRSQLPLDEQGNVIEMYDAGTQKILGRNGDGFNFTLSMMVLPTSGSTTLLETWIDIGGSVGELYRRLISFPKGVGVVRPVTISTIGYSLDTFEANGATVYVRANGTCSIYSTRYVLFRVHAAR